MPHLSVRHVPALVFVLGAALVPARAHANEPPSSVDIRSEPAGLEVLQQTGSFVEMPVAPRRNMGFAPTPEYRVVCRSTPCSAPMAEGDHVLALTKPGGRPVAADVPLSVHGPAVVDAQYVDRSGTRTAGLALLVGSLIAGTGMTLAAAELPGLTSPTRSFNPLLGGFGIGTLVFGSLTGLALLTRSDGITLNVTSLGLASSARAHEGDVSRPNGVVVAVRF